MACDVALLVAEGFSDSGLSIALDVLRTANAVARHEGRGEPFRVSVASPAGGPVRAASGMVVAPTRSSRAAARADVVAVVGLWLEDAAELEPALARDDVRRLVGTVARARARGALVGSSCSGAFVLGDAGVLDGRACTTTWWLAPHLQQRRPRARVDAKQALVADDGVVTAGAVFAQADLALHLVTRFAGPRAARQCSRLLLLDRHASQAAYMAVHQLATNDETVRRAESWARQHLADDFDMADLARAAGVSARTLARRLASAVGLGPIAFVQRLRVESAVRWLQTSTLSLDEVAARVGYGDPSALRRLIRRETGASPRELRRR